MISNQKAASWISQCWYIDQYTLQIMAPLFLASGPRVCHILKSVIYIQKVAACTHSNKTYYFPSHIIYVSKITFPSCLRKWSMYHSYWRLANSKRGCRAHLSRMCAELESQRLCFQKILLMWKMESSPQIQRFL